MTRLTRTISGLLKDGSYLKASRSQWLNLQALIILCSFQTSNCFSSVFTAGGDCTAYDVIVHPDFVERAKPRFLLQQFFLTLVLEGIANKYSLELSMSTFRSRNDAFCYKLNTVIDVMSSDDSKFQQEYCFQFLLTWVFRQISCSDFLAIWQWTFRNFRGQQNTADSVPLNSTLHVNQHHLKNFLNIILIN